MSRLLSMFSATDVKHIIAVITICGCFIFLFSLIFFKIPAENKELLNILGSGFIIAGGGQVYGYLFNSSKPSAKKQEPGE